MALVLNKEHAADLETRMALSRDNWQRSTAMLADDVEAWAGQEAAARGWRVEREEKKLAEELAGGEYLVPVITTHAPQGRLVLEPIARGTVGAQARWICMPGRACSG